MVPAADGLAPDWLPAGGLYGHRKWMPTSRGVDVFLPRGSVIRAPVAGVVVAPAELVRPFPPPVPGLGLRGDGGLWFFLCHVRPLAAPGTHVPAGQPLAVIDDPELELFPSPGPGPSSWQHVDLNLASDGFFTWYGGDIYASPWLQATGYQGIVVDRTPGPPDAVAGLGRLAAANWEAGQGRPGGLAQRGLPRRAPVTR